MEKTPEIIGKPPKSETTPEGSVAGPDQQARCSGDQEQLTTAATECGPAPMGRPAFLNSRSRSADR